MIPKKRVIVVGGGLAGQAAAIKLAEEDIAVDLISMVPVKRSHSVCAQGGINACNEVARQQGFSEWEHMSETLYGGDYLAHQPPVYEMTDWAPRIIDLFDRMGVPFNRTPEGNRDLRLFGGSLFRRTFFAGATTGQQLLYALDEQTRRAEAEGKVTKHEFWEFLRPILDDNGVCVGCVAQDMRTMQIRAFRGDAVVMCSGGNGLIFGQSTNSIVCTGGAASRCYQAGAWYANGEFIQVHPTAIPGADKCRLMSESARGEGGRIWVPRRAGDSRDPRQIPEAERFYFLEEKYPKYGNLVPRDIATREIFDICVNHGLGVGGGNMVYLDLTHMTREYLEGKLGGILEIYRKFAGDDPCELPMKIFPAVHYTMGGMWTTYTAKPDGRGMVYGAPNTMMTNIEGLYALGEVNYQYHGATRLGANALLSCTFDGLFAAKGIAERARGLPTAAADLAANVFDDAVDSETRKMQNLIDANGRENPYEIAREMGLEMTAASTVVKTEARMTQAMTRLHELQDRYTRISLSDHGLWTNQNLSFARAVGDMLKLAEVILLGGVMRKESRGSHYRSDYPQRDDPNFLKTTVAAWDASTGHPSIRYEEITMGLVQPKARTYGKVEKDVAEKKPGKEKVAASV